MRHAEHNQLPVVSQMQPEGKARCLITKLEVNGELWKSEGLSKTSPEEGNELLMADSMKMVSK